MELHELYAVHLHGEDAAALGATEQQQFLIKIIDTFPDQKELYKELNKLYTVKKRHDNGIEFCGASLKQRIASEKICKLIELVESGKSVGSAAKELGVSREWCFWNWDSKGMFTISRTQMETFTNPGDTYI